jgi:spore coat polysaccharide biosynthesis protein SpsF
MEALNRVPCDLRVLACPEDCESSFSALARRAGFELTTGPKDDVLGRFCGAIRRFRPDYIIRATGDNPFVFADAAAALAARATNARAPNAGVPNAGVPDAGVPDADYSAYAGLPFGAGVEAVKAAALLRAEAEATEAFDREHVCPYLYNHPDRFRLHRPPAPACWQDPLSAENRVTRLSVDTAGDLERANVLYAALTEEYGDRRFLGENIIRSFLKNIVHRHSENNGPEAFA